MLQVFRNAWKVEDLRKKILYTIMIVIIFRIGCAIPVPFINKEALAALFSGGDAASNFLGYLNVLSGSALKQATVFALSISPYITASIVIQLLTIAIPALERLSKEGEEGRKKLAQWTRYSTVLLGLITGFGYYTVLRASGALTISANATSFEKIFVATVIIATFVAGSVLIMWLGEKINERGIGNGISIILFAGIVSALPSFIAYAKGFIDGGRAWIIPLVVIGAVLLIAFVVIMNNAERRIPIQYAKRVVGRKVYGGQSTHIPIKVSMSGVMPIIFASSLVSLPGMLIVLFNGGKTPTSGLGSGILNLLAPRGAIYIVLMFVLIIAFTYFYVLIQFNPIEVANNLKKNGGFVPGIRPGKPTIEFMQKILNRITLIGALFLGLIAVLPNIIDAFLNIGINLGGTSLIIVVGVALETVKQLESQMLMRHYKGFLE